MVQQVEIRMERRPEMFLKRCNCNLQGYQVRFVYRSRNVESSLQESSVSYA